MSVKLTYVGTQVEKRKPNLPKLPKFMRFLLAPFLNCIIMAANTLTWLSNQRAAGENVVYKIYSVALSGSYIQGGAIGVKGEVLNFQTPLNPGYGARTKLPGVLGLPNSTGGTTANTDALPASSAFEVPPVYGYEFQIEQNAVNPTNANYIMRIFSTGGTELASGLYSSVAADLVAVGAQPIIIKVRVPAKYN
jgi:hypothetical protein